MLYNELDLIRERFQGEVAFRSKEARQLKESVVASTPYKYHALVCGGPGCSSSGSLQVANVLNQELKKHGLEKEVCVVMTGCQGLCAAAPVVIIHPGAVFYAHLKAENIREIVTEHFMKGHIVNRLLYQETITDDGIKPFLDTDFYQKEYWIALRNCGIIDPENIDEYIGNGGYKALAKALALMTPDEVIQTVIDSGLRGRGGGGFPTGLKWKFASSQQSGKGNRGEVQKYVACNADEGDPGAFMDRAILEGDPHVVLEAMAIAGYAIGASRGYIYVRAEYPVAVQRLRLAIAQAKDYGLLGKNVFGSGFDFDIELRLGAGAFVCGEETALLTSIEGNRGEPRPRPPFPAVKGLFGKPTILNNVETYANIPRIILNGGEWFASIGTEKSKGTKVFCLCGKIQNTGLVEVPMGTSLRIIVEEIGGGIPDGKKFKAAQTGGPSGGCIPAKLLDIPIDYESLTEVGSMMGSGGLIVLDEDNCMVDIAKFFLEFTVDESCGKCTPCRVGTKRMLEILEKITIGQGSMRDIGTLEELANYIKSNSICGLGQTAPNPVLSTLRYFRHEYEEHVVEKKCKAGVCKHLLTYKIHPKKCKGCTLCAKICPAHAITGDVKKIHVINTNICIKCGACSEICPFRAIYVD